MDVQVVVRNVTDAAPLRALAEGKLAAALERYEEHVLTAVLRLEDQTGPRKGGVDKLCSIDVKLRTGDVIIKEQGEVFEATIDKALDRLRAQLSREVGRHKRGVAEG